MGSGLADAGDPHLHVLHTDQNAARMRACACAVERAPSVHIAAQGGEPALLNPDARSRSHCRDDRPRRTCFSEGRALRVKLSLTKKTGDGSTASLTSH